MKCIPRSYLGTIHSTLGRTFSRLAFVCIVWLAVTSGSTVASPNGDGDRSILLIHSYHPTLEWTDALGKAFGAAFEDVPGVRIDSEYLDAKRRPSLDHAETFLELMREKYSARLPDVLVISDDPAFELLQKHRHDLFPEVPVVFLGLNGMHLVGDTKQMTGIFERHRTDITVELALSLTKAEGIIVVNDTSETGLANEAKLKNLQQKHPGIHWVVVRDLPANDTFRLTQWPSDWPVFTMSPLRESGPSSPMISQMLSVQLLRESIPNPLFIDTEWLMGAGVVGGYSLSSDDHGRQAATLVQKILSGISVEEIPFVLDTKHHWLFDQRELTRFGWEHDQLPEGANIWFAAQTYWERHRAFLYPAFALLALALLIIAILSVTVRRQKRAEARLRVNEHRLTAALSAADAGVFEVRANSQYASMRWLEMTNASLGAKTDEWTADATEKSRVAFERSIERLQKGATNERLEIVIESDSSEKVLDVLMTTDRQRSQSEADFAIVGVATDITERRQLEEEAVRRSRLEAIGQVAGGIAHDFGNILCVVMNAAEYIRAVDDIEEIRTVMGDVEEASERARQLVRELLDSGRRERQLGPTIELNAAVAELQPFLQRMVGRQYEIKLDLDDDTIGITLERTHLEQVLSNLVVNARDAMNDHGVVHIETSVSKENLVVLRVRDTGEGMDEAKARRVFEAFYTTKPIGKGTGLGLSTVQGLVKRSGGTIDVDSELGRGTSFELRWPRAPLGEQAVTSWELPGNVASESEDTLEPLEPRRAVTRRVLFVEDNLAVGTMAKRFLVRDGFEVALAADGHKGLAMFAAEPDKFDLVLSDCMLPNIDGVEMGGVEMIEEIRQLRPQIRYGFVSGHLRHGASNGSNGSGLSKDAPLLPKPFSQHSLSTYAEHLLNN